VVKTWGNARQRRSWAPQIDCKRSKAHRAVIEGGTHVRVCSAVLWWSTSVTWPTTKNGDMGQTPPKQSILVSRQSDGSPTERHGAPHFFIGPRHRKWYFNHCSTEPTDAYLSVNFLDCRWRAAWQSRTDLVHGVRTHLIDVGHLVSSTSQLRFLHDSGALSQLQSSLIATSLTPVSISPSSITNKRTKSLLRWSSSPLRRFKPARAGPN